MKQTGESAFSLAGSSVRDLLLTEPVMHANLFLPVHGAYPFINKRMIIAHHTGIFVTRIRLDPVYAVVDHDLMGIAVMGPHVGKTDIVGVSDLEKRCAVNAHGLERDTKRRGQRIFRTIGESAPDKIIVQKIAMKVSGEYCVICFDKEGGPQGE